MEHELAFDTDTYRQKLAAWKNAGASSIVIEWSTGSGPVVFYYPARERALGQMWSEQASPDHYSDRVADFMEFKLIPRLSEIAREIGLAVTSICADQQPVLMMRIRRREIERAQAEICSAAAS